MRAGVLFSGGKDSALAALLLAPHHLVEVGTCASSPARDLAAVEVAAAALGFPWHRARLPDAVLASAVDRIVADGTRFGDRVPMLEPDEARSLIDAGAPMSARCSGFRGTTSRGSGSATSPSSAAKAGRCRTAMTRGGCGRHSAKAGSIRSRPSPCRKNRHSSVAETDDRRN